MVKIDTDAHVIHISDMKSIRYDYAIILKMYRIGIKYKSRYVKKIL